MRPIPRNYIVQRARHIFVRNLKDHSENIIKVWTDQCEFIFAQKVRRGQQIFTHYRKLWNDKELMQFLMRIRKQWILHTKGLLLASVPLAFDWNKERIPNEIIYEQLHAIEYVHKLHDGTLLCDNCRLRRMIDRRVDGISYCRCRPRDGTATATMDEWEPYLERDNIIIWRRAHVGDGQFEYKVYGKYEDVTAEDFFFVQTDVAYRKVWDKSALTLEIVDTDEANTNCNVLYWELLWPKLFANRDFVFKRRTLIDKKAHRMVIVNQSTEHPSCPVLGRNQRVNDYWSYMVIKPKTTFRRPGLEFVVTYFDNPGIVMPPTVTKWVSRIYMPDFLNKLHQATIRYASGKDLSLISDERFNDDAEEMGGTAIDFFWNNVPDPGFEYPPEKELHSSPGKRVKHGGGGDKGSKSSRKNPSVDAKQSQSADQLELETSSDNELETGEKSGEGKRTSWWSYLHPFSYFA